MNATRCIRSIGVFFFLPPLLLAADQKQSATAQPDSRLNIHTGFPQATLINVNNISAWFESKGEQERDPVTGNAGFWYPHGTATAVYCAGTFWGGMVRDGQTPALRVNGQTYNSGMKPGVIQGLRTGIAEDPASPDVRIWRIRKDFATADLTRDAAETFRIPLSSVTPDQIQKVRDQYAKDWAEWPWQKGAPYYDKNGNGIRDSGEDPGLASADQVIWFACNDIGVAQPWQCPEIGIEEQATIWAYDTSGALGNAIFKRVRLFYKGTASTPAGAHIDSMYFGQFTDTDLGFCCDDYDGCDTMLNLGFTYNGAVVDPDYMKFGLPPPAFGSAVLEGPRVVTGNPADSAMYDLHRIPGSVNLRMTAFFGHVTGGRYSDPPFSFTGAIEWYQVMRGLPPQPPGGGPGINDPAMIVNPVTGQPTPFWWSGDPVSGSGWITKFQDQPGDSRFWIFSGPFEMALGGTQEIVFADVGGLGRSNLPSISVMKFYASTVKELFEVSAGDFDLQHAEQAVPQMPQQFVLEQNYPNPFNPGTSITFQLPVAGFVTLKVIDLLGREVTTLVNEVKQPGRYTVAWDGRGFASGVYFYTIQAGNFVQTRKLILLK
jgi:hypothetical protein